VSREGTGGKPSPLALSVPRILRNVCAEVVPLVSMVAGGLVWGVYMSYRALESPDVFFFRPSPGVYGEAEAERGQATIDHIHAMQDTFNPLCRKLWGLPPLAERYARAE
jgi:hypothetical protein